MSDSDPEEEEDVAVDAAAAVASCCALRDRGTAGRFIAADGRAKGSGRAGCSCCCWRPLLPPPLRPLPASRCSAEPLGNASGSGEEGSDEYAGGS